MALNVNQQLAFLEKKTGLKLIESNFTIEDSKIIGLDLADRNLSSISFLEKFTDLKYLDISNNPKIEQCDIIGIAKDLVVLHVSSTGIRNWKYLENLKKLENLSIENNLIIDTNFMNELSNLKKLKFGNNNLFDCNFLGNLINLESLIIEDKKYKYDYNYGRDTYKDAVDCIDIFEVFEGDYEKNIIVEPSHISNLKKLNELIISNDTFCDFKFVKSLSKLEKLIITKSRIKDIDFFLDKYLLKYVDLSYNKITNISPLTNLQKLISLDISNNNISDISPLSSLKDSINLISLDISNNVISDISPLGNLKNSINLYKLNISNNNISDISSLIDLKIPISLTSLDISNNNISNISILKKFINLKHLNLRKNKITDITSLSVIPNLIKINIGENLVIDLTPLLRLDKIEDLNLAYNQITVLTFPMYQLMLNLNRDIDFWLSSALKYNIVRTYQDKTIGQVKPVERKFLENQRIDDSEKIYLQNLYLEQTFVSNPITTPPKEILKQGDKAIIDYFIAIREGSVVNQEAKIVLFGNSKVGKSTLSHQLRNNVFNASIESTHGILVDKWIIDIKDYPTNLLEKIESNIEEYKKENKNSKIGSIPQSLKLNIWDFGGQEYFHATHRLFLNNNVIYLLVWEEDSDYLNEYLGIYPKVFWINNINHYAPKSVILIVQNKARYNYLHDLSKLRFKISYRNSDNEDSSQEFELDIIKIKKAILKELANLNYLGQVFPQVYDSIRQGLQNHRENYLTFDEYKSYCINKDDTIAKIMSSDSQIKTLTEYLHDTGSLICYRYIERKKKISNNILENYVFIRPQWITSVIYAVLDEVILGNSGEFDITHVDRVSMNYQIQSEVLISLMKNFELIFEITKKGKIYYIAPQYLPLQCKNIEALDMALDDRNIIHSFSMSYPDFIPTSLFLRFIALYGSQSKSYLYWKTGIVFTKIKTVFVEYVNSNLERRISVYIQDNDISLAKELFNSLYALEESDNLLLSVDKINFEKYDVLSSYFDQSISNFLINGIKFTLKEFDFIFNNKPQKQMKVFVSYSKEDLIHLKALSNHLSVLKRQGKISLWTDQELKPGDKWDSSIKQMLEESDIIIFLVSSDFLATDYIWDSEIKRAIERDNDINDEVKVIPIIIRECDWTDSPLGVYNTAPRKALVINSQSNIDKAWLDTIKDLKKIIL